MNRRMFLCGFTFGACAAAFVGEAQQTGKVYRIGVLDTLSAALNSANLNPFRQGLRELGYVEGQHFVIEYRSADGRAQQFPGLATELVRLKVDLIVTRGTPAVSKFVQDRDTDVEFLRRVGFPPGHHFGKERQAGVGHASQWFSSFGVTTITREQHPHLPGTRTGRLVAIALRRPQAFQCG